MLIEKGPQSLPPQNQERIIIPSWEISVTRVLSLVELHELRDLAPKMLVSQLAQKETHFQNSAIEELIRHGHIKKAAEIARGLIAESPLAELSLREGFGDEMTEELLDGPVDRFAANPSEYGVPVVITF